MGGGGGGGGGASSERRPSSSHIQTMSSGAAFISSAGNQKVCDRFDTGRGTQKNPNLWLSEKVF